jgi:hypothetical protein
MKIIPRAADATISSSIILIRLPLRPGVDEWCYSIDCDRVHDTTDTVDYAARSWGIPAMSFDSRRRGTLDRDAGTIDVTIGHTMSDRSVP